MRSHFFIAVAIVLGCACRKPPPLEVVYAGKSPAAGATGGGNGASTPGRTPDPPPDSSFKKTALLDAIAQCSLTQAQRFEGVARELRDAANAWAQDPSEARAITARTAWLAAMASWEETEIFYFGPAAPAAEPGGQSLRDQIYAWPLFSRCRVEEQIVSQAYTQPSFGSSLVNGRTLASFEFVAFYTGTDNACSQFSAINAQGSWAALGSPEIARRKAAYGAAVANDVYTRAQALLFAWNPTQGNFVKELVTAGTGSKIFPSDQDAFNSISDGMFYAEKTVKDQKLGRPLGLIDCFEPTCPDGVESPFAKASTTHLKANLVAFRKLFEGCGNAFSGVGFDDWLTAIGDGDLANRMLAALKNAQLVVDALGAPIGDVLASDIAKVRAVHTAVKALTDLLKTEFITVLNLELPKSAEGDND